ncbi:MAG: nuclear transport factor 2 family protein [Sphingorhabdus sp.]|uniref:YybH family protein n=1 Tax=Sphingorhabdus sp. TaxID=1902408 RepID=UPI003C81789D
MRNLIVAGLLASLFDASGALAANACKDVETAFAAHAKAVASRDIAALASTLTRDEGLILILPNGKLTKTRNEYLEFHRAFFAEPSWSIAFEPISKLEGKDFAVITTKSRYRDVDDGKPFESSNWVTFGFKRENGCWKLVHDQNTRRPAE